MHTDTRRVRVWTKPKDLTWNCCFRRVSPAFSRFYEKQPKKSWERSQKFQAFDKMAGFCQNYRKFVANSQNSGISLEKWKMSSKFTQIDDFRLNFRLKLCVNVCLRLNFQQKATFYWKMKVFSSKFQPKTGFNRNFEHNFNKNRKFKFKFQEIRLF